MRVAAAIATRDALALVAAVRASVGSTVYASEEARAGPLAPLFAVNEPLSYDELLAALRLLAHYYNDVTGSDGWQAEQPGSRGSWWRWAPLLQAAQRRRATRRDEASARIVAMLDRGAFEAWGVLIQDRQDTATRRPAQPWEVWRREFWTGGNAVQHAGARLASMPGDCADCRVLLRSQWRVARDALGAPIARRDRGDSHERTVYERYIIIEPKTPTGHTRGWKFEEREIAADGGNEGSARAPDEGGGRRKRGRGGETAVPLAPPTTYLDSMDQVTREALGAQSRIAAFARQTATTFEDVAAADTRAASFAWADTTVFAATTLEAAIQQAVASTLRGGIDIGFAVAGNEVPGSARARWFLQPDETQLPQSRNSIYSVTLQSSERVTALAVRGTSVLMATDGSRVLEWSRIEALGPTSAPVHPTLLYAAASEVLSLAVLSNGICVAGLSSGQIVLVGDDGTGVPVSSSRPHSKAVMGVAAADNGGFASCGTDGRVYVWRALPSGDYASTLVFGSATEPDFTETAPVGILGVACARGNVYFAAKNSVWQWSERGNRTIQLAALMPARSVTFGFVSVPASGQTSVTAIAATDEGVLVGCADGSLRHFADNTTIAGLIGVLHMDGEPVHSVITLPGRRVVSGTPSGSLRVWALPPAAGVVGRYFSGYKLASAPLVMPSSDGETTALAAFGNGVVSASGKTFGHPVLRTWALPAAGPAAARHCGACVLRAALAAEFR